MNCPECDNEHLTDNYEVNELNRLEGGYDVMWRCSECGHHWSKRYELPEDLSKMIIGVFTKVTFHHIIPVESLLEMVEVAAALADQGVNRPVSIIEQWAELPYAKIIYERMLAAREENKSS